MISKNIIKLDYTFKIVCAGNYFPRLGIDPMKMVHIYHA